MGTCNIEEEMDGEIFSRKFSIYKKLLQEYSLLAAKCALTSAEADRMEMILDKASLDPFLGLLVDEADHIIAHELGLIDPGAIEYQQQELLALLDQKIAEKTESILNTDRKDAVSTRENLARAC